MTRTRRLLLGLAGLGAVLLGLTVAGAFMLWTYDHGALFRLVLAQGLVYAAAAWLIVSHAPAGRALARRVTVGVLALAALMRAVIVVAPPVSTDIYRYVWDGRVQGSGVNPYIHLPVAQELSALRDEAIHPKINRADYAPTIYPPAAQIVFFLVTRVSETVTAMKLAMVAFEALAVWAILDLLARRDLSPTRVLLYAWHPLPLWEFAGSGHVDAVAIAFLLLAFVAADRRLPALAGAALAAGALAKYFPVVAGPALYKRWDWRLPAAFAGTLVLLYLPYLGAGWKLTGFLGGYVAEEGLASGAGVFPLALLVAFVPPPAAAASLYIPAAALVMAMLAAAMFFTRREPGADLAMAMTLAIAFTVFFSPHHAWYFAWLVPFLAFRPSPAVIYLTTSATMLYFVGWPPAVAGGALIYGPFAVALTIEAAVGLRSKGGRHGSAVAV